MVVVDGLGWICKSNSIIGLGLVLTKKSKRLLSLLAMDCKVKAVTLLTFLCVFGFQDL